MVTLRLPMCRDLASAPWPWMPGCGPSLGASAGSVWRSGAAIPFWQRSPLMTLEVHPTAFFQYASHALADRARHWIQSYSLLAFLRRYRSCACRLSGILQAGTIVHALDQYLEHALADASAAKCCQTVAAASVTISTRTVQPRVLVQSFISAFSKI